MKLAELQRLFAGVLLDGDDERALRGQIVDDLPLLVYADMYRLRLYEVLGELYPRTRALLAEAWDATVAAYVRASPSRSQSLRDYGRDFAERLAPAPASLARLEWARYDVFDAVDEPLLTGPMLGALAPDDLLALPLTRIAASRILHVPVDATALWSVGDSLEAPELTSAILLVWREDVTLYHRRVDEREARWLARLDGTLTLGALCAEYAPELDVNDAAQAVFALVGRWVADGLLRV